MTSCCTWCNVPERVVEVKIPVPVACPAPPIFEDIVDPVLNFTIDTTIEQKIKDLRTSRVVWRERAKQQEVLLDSYRQNVTQEKKYFKNYTGQLKWQLRTN